jgi:hypothetical protein
VEVKGCEKLTQANVIIAYELSSGDAKVKTKFHDELYGRKKEGLLFRIPHRKLARGVIEISQRNLGDVRGVFDKYGIGYELRLTIPESNSDKIVKIVGNIEDPYEKSLSFDSLSFSEFVTAKLDNIGEESMEKRDRVDELLAVKDTMEKWVKKHKEKPLAMEFAYMFRSLEVAVDKSPEDMEKLVKRIAESIRHWTIGYRILENSKDNESIDETLKKYRAGKQQV